MATYLLDTISSTTPPQSCKLWYFLPFYRTTCTIRPFTILTFLALSRMQNFNGEGPSTPTTPFEGCLFPSHFHSFPVIKLQSSMPIITSIPRASFPPAYFHVSSAILLNLIKMNTKLNNFFSKYLKGASMGSFLLVGLGYLALNSYYYVDVGHYAIKFNKLFGLSPQVYREGYNLKLPFIEQPIIYNVQTRENEIFAETANRDMQSIKLSVRVLFHPEVSKLDVIYTRLGKNYEQKILPAICNEILRTVVAQFSAAQLLSQRDQVSERIKHLLSERAAHFNIIIDNLAITDLTFGKEYLEAIEGKQVAQQEAERAKYEVQQAKEAKKSTVIKAEASAKSIELVGQASKNNPSYLDVRKIEYTEKIAQILAESRNKLLLNNDILNMSLPKTTSVSYEEKVEEVVSLPLAQPTSVPEEKPAGKEKGKK